MLSEDIQFDLSKGNGAAASAAQDQEDSGDDDEGDVLNKKGFTEVEFNKALLKIEEATGLSQIDEIYEKISRHVDDEISLEEKQRNM